jgi:hypothetical protein
MDLFKPSYKIMNLISSGKINNFREYNPLIFYEIYKDMKRGFGGQMASGLFSRIQEYYKIGLEPKRLSIQKVWNVFGEAAKNSVDHSLSGKEIFTIGYYFGDKGVCYGFNDGGDYFKNEKIKHQYENKIRITEFDQSTLEDCSQVGVNSHIYPYSDKIEVDSEKGILYCVQLKNSIIAPEGEEGNKYFWRNK